MEVSEEAKKSEKTATRWLLIGVLGLAIVFGIFVLTRLPAAFDRVETEETIAFIQAQKITLADVMGDNLPPTPDPALVDATVEGVDANTNGIRDDVELAIFDLYPDNAVIRSAMLQYAMGLQLELTQVSDSETWVAAVEESGRGGSCLFATSPDVSFENTQEELNAAFAVGDERTEAVEGLVYDTEIRIERRDEVIKFITGHGESDKDSDCDIDPESLVEEDA